MRRKFGILILVGITVLAGSQEAVRQVRGLKSALAGLTRASLWSGLIVYAQPVTDGKLPAPQIYYLMPQQQPTPAAQAAALAVNNEAATPKPAAKNNHAAEEVAADVDKDIALATAREVREAAKPGFVFDKLPLNPVASRLVPVVPEPEKMRLYEEVAKNEAFVHKFKSNADAVAKAFVKEFDGAKLEAEAARLEAAQERIGQLKFRATVEAEKSNRRVEVRVMRRHARPERVERIKVLNTPAEKRMITLPEMSSVGCERTRIAKAAEAAPAATGVAEAVVRIAGEPVTTDLASPVVSFTTSTNWALGCDNEPEQE